MKAVVIDYGPLESVVYISQKYQSTMRSMHFLRALNLITTLFYETVSPVNPPVDITCISKFFQKRYHWIRVSRDHFLTVFSQQY